MWKTIFRNDVCFQKNLAKFKRGKHGAGLDDIDIEELDWVRDININSKVI